MGDREVQSASGSGLANVFELEERHARHKGVAAQPGEEGDVTFVGDEPGVLGAGEHRSWQVDKLASAAPGPGGDDDEAARTEHGLAPAQDGCEAAEEIVEALVSVAWWRVLAPRNDSWGNFANRSMNSVDKPVDKPVEMHRNGTKIPIAGWSCVSPIRTSDRCATSSSSSWVTSIGRDAGASKTFVFEIAYSYPHAGALTSKIRPASGG